MNVRDFVLAQLEKRPHGTEELASILPLDKATRLGKTLATLEIQGKIKQENDVWIIC